MNIPQTQSPVVLPSKSRYPASFPRAKETAMKNKERNMEDALIKPDIVLVTKNIMVPVALPAPQNKLFPAPGSSRRKTTIVRTRKTRVSPKRAARSGENTVLRTSVELLRSSDYLACDYDSLVDWEQDFKKDYELLYSEGLMLGDAGFGDSRTVESKRLDYSSQSFPKHCKAFSSMNDKQCWNSDEADGKDMLIESSRRSRIDLGEKKNELKNINLGAKLQTLGDSMSGETKLGRNEKQNCSSQRFPIHSMAVTTDTKNFETLSDRKDNGTEETDREEINFGRSMENVIKLFDTDIRWKPRESGSITELRRCASSEMSSDENEKQNCLSQRFPTRSTVAPIGIKISKTSPDRKPNSTAEPDHKEITFERSTKNELNILEANVRRSSKESTSITELPRCTSSKLSSDEKKKQNCLSQSFPTHSTAAPTRIKISKTSLLSPDRKPKTTEEPDHKETTFERSTKNDLKIFKGTVRKSSEESSSITKLRRSTSSKLSSERPKSFDRDRNKTLDECEIKYSWQDLENWVPPSAKKRIAEIDEKSDLSGAKKTGCKITYSWQIIGTAAQTSQELIRSLLTSAVEPEAKRDVEATNYPCSVKYSWQIIGTGTQVCFSRVNNDSLPIDEEYWNGKIIKPRKRIPELWKEEINLKAGKCKILYNEMTQTVTDESHQTEFGDCRVKYSWQNLTKPYLEKNRRS